MVLRTGVNTLNDTALGRTCADAYDEWGIHAFSVLELLIEEGRLRARRLGNQWAVPASDLRIAANTLQTGPGRPLSPGGAWEPVPVVSGWSNSAADPVTVHVVDDAAWPFAADERLAGPWVLISASE